MIQINLQIQIYLKNFIFLEIGNIWIWFGNVLIFCHEERNIIWNIRVVESDIKQTNRTLTNASNSSANDYLRCFVFDSLKIWEYAFISSNVVSNLSN